jgi:hypothetical protein
MNNNLLLQINNLKTLTMKQLRQRWLVLFTTDPPAYGRTYLERRLAYRIQELAHGTDTARLERKMEEAAKGRLNKKKSWAQRYLPPCQRHPPHPGMGRGPSPSHRAGRWF